ncbi:hypothetical protein HW555_002384 [Spodoptera exigua]|uniref:Uncharacterized protein n=1 Tax=Spodoptera exigua TaxID=7107 RepID=A0A835L9F9_SPOEX|nr:hypothetical protein HW555_002384 [Spodoptera exigua]
MELSLQEQNPDARSSRWGKKLRARIRYELMSHVCFVMESSTHSSLDPVLFVQSESSISLTSSSEESLVNIKVISYLDSNYHITSSKHYLYCYVPDGRGSEQSNGGTEQSANVDNSDVSIENNTSEYTDSEDHALGTIHRLKNEDGYIIYRLTQQNQTENYNSKRRERQKNKEPVIVINNLDGKHDIEAMVNQILAQQELSNASSLFVVVPTSEENIPNPMIAPPRSTVCVQLSEHRHNNWNENDEIDELDLVPPHTRGLKISTKGKKFCLEGLTETLSSLNDEETKKGKRRKFFKMFHKHEKKEKVRETENKTNAEEGKEGVIDKREKATKNKLCQITTPMEMFRKIQRSISDETTAIDQGGGVSTENKPSKDSKQGCVESSNVVSELITPLLVNQGLKCDRHRRRPLMISVTQQASIMSIGHRSAVSPCHISGGSISGGRRNAMQLDKIPIKLICPPAENPNDTTEAPETGGDTICKNHPESELEEDSNTGCTCSGKRKRISCPCELFPLPISKTTDGPKTGTRSLSCQCCDCGDKNLGKCTMEVVGPAGGVSLIESDGTYTQAGMIQAEAGTGTDIPLKECFKEELATNRLNIPLASRGTKSGLESSRSRLAQTSLAPNVMAAAVMLSVTIPASVSISWLVVAHDPGAA